MSFQFGIYKFLVFSEILAHHFNSPISDYVIDTLNYAESIDYTQEHARTYALEFAEN